MVSSTRSDPHEPRSTTMRASERTAEQPPPPPVEEPAEEPQTEAPAIPLQPGPTPRDLAEALAKYLDEHGGPQFDAELNELRARGSVIFARLRERYGSQQLEVAARELKRSRGYSY